MGPNGVRVVSRKPLGILTKLLPYNGKPQIIRTPYIRTRIDGVHRTSGYYLHAAAFR